VAEVVHEKLQETDRRGWGGIEEGAWKRERKKEKTPKKVGKGRAIRRGK